MSLKFGLFVFLSLCFGFSVNGVGQETEGILFVAKDETEKTQIKKDMKELFEKFEWGEGQVVSHEDGNKVWYTLNSPKGETSTFELSARKDLKIEENVETFINSEGEEKSRAIATDKEILAAMLQHGRTHEFKGKDASVERLLDHVGIRQEIVRANKSAYWIFPEGKAAEKNPKVWNKDFTVKQGVDVLDAIEDAWQGYKSKFGYEPGCTTGLKLIWIRGLIRYYTKKGDAKALEEIRKQLGSDPLTKIEVDTGWDKNGVEYVTKPTAFMTLHSQIPWDNWVPGDWGYIQNTKFEHGNEDPEYTADHQGLEGHNMAYSGDGIFAAYYRDSYNLDLDDNIEIVYNWRDEEDQERLTPKLKAALRRDPYDKKYEGGLLHASRYVPVLFGESRPKNVETKTKDEKLTTDMNAHNEKKEEKKREEAAVKEKSYDLEADIDEADILNADSITLEESSETWKICGEVSINPNPDTNPGVVSTITTCQTSENKFVLPVGKTSELLKKQLQTLVDISAKGKGFGCISIQSKEGARAIAPDKEEDEIYHVLPGALSVAPFSAKDTERAKQCSDDPELEEIEKAVGEVAELNPNSVGEKKGPEDSVKPEEVVINDPKQEEAAFKKLVQHYEKYYSFPNNRDNRNFRTLGRMAIEGELKKHNQKYNAGRELEFTEQKQLRAGGSAKPKRIQEPKEETISETIQSTIGVVKDTGDKVDALTERINQMVKEKEAETFDEAGEGVKSTHDGVDKILGETAKLLSQSEVSNKDLKDFQKIPLQAIKEQEEQIGDLQRHLNLSREWSNTAAEHRKKAGGIFLKLEDNLREMHGVSNALKEQVQSWEKLDRNFEGLFTRLDRMEHYADEFVTNGHLRDEIFKNIHEVRRLTTALDTERPRQNYQEDVLPYLKRLRELFESDKLQDKGNLKRERDPSSRHMAEQFLGKRRQDIIDSKKQILNYDRSVETYAQKKRSMATQPEAEAYAAIIRKGKSVDLDFQGKYQTAINNWNAGKMTRLEWDRWMNQFVKDRASAFQSLQEATAIHNKNYKTNRVHPLVDLDAYSRIHQTQKGHPYTGTAADWNARVDQPTPSGRLTRDQEIAQHQRDKRQLLAETRALEAKFDSMDKARVAVLIRQYTARLHALEEQARRLGLPY